MKNKIFEIIKMCWFVWRRYQKKLWKKQENISFINAIVETYVDGLTSYINQYFDVESADSIQLIGCGAIQLERNIKDEYEKAELHPNAAFANANTYEKVGEILWI